MKTVLLAAVFASSVIPMYAQPAGPPPVLSILRETVKEGKGAAHRRVEQDYANTFRRNKFPFHYIGLSPVSGPNEVLFLEAYPSFAALEESDKLSDKAPLKNELELVEARDGELRSNSRSMTAVYRKDMSYDPPDGVSLVKTHYMMISTYRVKLGKDEELMAGGKMILAALEKAHSNAPVLTYQVVAGAPDGVYLFFFPMASMKEMDDQPAREKAMMDAMGEDNFRKLMSGAGDVFLTMENALYSVTPQMSYVSKETEDADPRVLAAKGGRERRAGQGQGERRERSIDLNWPDATLGPLQNPTNLAELFLTSLFVCPGARVETGCNLAASFK